MFSLITCNMIRLTLLHMFNYFREEFDDEKEPDEMVLSGWNRAPATETINKEVDDNGTSTCIASQTATWETNEDDDSVRLPTSIELPLGNERKLSDSTLAAGLDLSNVLNETKVKRKAEELNNDDGDVILLDDGNTNYCKKQRGAIVIFGH